MAEENPFAKFGVSDAELAKHIRESAEADAAINEFMEKEVVPYGRSVSPVESGKYAASWKVMKKAKNGRGLVGPTSSIAAIIEYGSGAPGPTTAFAPAEKTAAHFGGTLKGITSPGERE